MQVLSHQRFQIRVIPPLGNKSAPIHVLKSLSDFKKEYQVKGIDELWMVIDRDKWDIRMLTDVQSQCKQNFFGLSISNPCFEIWLILHLQDLTKVSNHQRNELLANNKEKGRQATKRCIANLMGNENLNNYTFLISNILEAIKNPQTLRETSHGNILENLGTEVDLIFQNKL